MHLSLWPLASGVVPSDGRRSAPRNEDRNAGGQSHEHAGIHGGSISHETGQARLPFAAGATRADVQDRSTADQATAMFPLRSLYVLLVSIVRLVVHADGRVARIADAIEEKYARPGFTTEATLRTTNDLSYQ